MCKLQLTATGKTTRLQTTDHVLMFLPSLIDFRLEFWIVQINPGRPCLHSKYAWSLTGYEKQDTQKARYLWYWRKYVERRLRILIQTGSNVQITFIRQNSSDLRAEERKFDETNSYARVGLYIDVKLWWWDSWAQRLCFYAESSRLEVRWKRSADRRLNCRRPSWRYRLVLGETPNWGINTLKGNFLKRLRFCKFTVGRWLFVIHDWRIKSVFFL